MKTKKSAAEARQELFQCITDQIVAILEEGGKLPYTQGWLQIGAPTSLSTGKLYRGVNALLLSLVASKRGYTSNYWTTYNQCKEQGGHVKAGEKGTRVVFWGRTVKEYEAEDGKQCEHVRYIARAYVVFNTDQCEGLNVPAPKLAQHEPIAAAEAIVAGYKDAPQVITGGSECCYSPREDTVYMPHLGAFISPEEYYSALFHELAHSTGNEKRLDRKNELARRHGTACYSHEELVAELTAAFLCAQCGIEKTTIRNNAAYLSEWLGAAQKDACYLISIAQYAQKAADYILGTTFDD